MISRQEAETIAAEWARQETQRRGYQCGWEVVEFDLGYVVWFSFPAEVRMMPGDGATIVIDRETGETSSWPRIPPEFVQDMYRESRAARPPAPRTLDQAEQLRRSIRRSPTPGMVAKLMAGGEFFTARGAKGDLVLNHHRLVRDWLDALPPGHLVRGGDRHAELIVISDALYRLDQQRATTGQPPLSMDEARELLHAAPFDVIPVREPGDPVGGSEAVPCESCLAALIHFGVIPPTWRQNIAPWWPEPMPLPDYAKRFPPKVAYALVAGYWVQDFRAETFADIYIEEVCAVPGHEPFPAVRQALVAFPGLISNCRGPGEEVAIRRIRIQPKKVAHSVASLADLAAVLGVRLFPIADEGLNDSIVAVDELGRVFALDQGGEWFLGADIEQAMINLLLGRAAARVRDDGTW